MKKILVILVASILMFSGCATKKVNTTQPQVTQEKEVVIHYNPQKMLGITLGCSKKEPGFTKEQCGDDWGREIYIDWGGVE